MRSNLYPSSGSSSYLVSPVPETKDGKGGVMGGGGLGTHREFRIDSERFGLGGEVT